jgi:imidazolonepropionase-like amidohydrolase
MVASAYEAGVQIYAGTDAGGALAHGRIADEVAALIAAGLPAPAAIGGASWRARDWLGREGIADGASADLVIYDEDPREVPGVLGHPRRIVLRGTVVA